MNQARTSHRRLESQARPYLAGRRTPAPPHYSKPPPSDAFKPRSSRDASCLPPNTAATSSLPTTWKPERPKTIGTQRTSTHPRMSSTDSARLRRLNGRLQACDPCRRRKVACDHGQPVCQRCRSKQWDTRCTYTITARSAVPLASRLTPTTPTTLIASSSPPPPVQARHHEVQIASTAPARDTTQEQTPTSASTPGTAIVTPHWKAPGYLGYASYNTVLDEARERLPVPDQEMNTGNDTGLQAPTSDIRVSELVLAACVAVLRLLPLQEESSIPPHDFLVLFQWLHRLGLSIRESLYDPNIFGTFLGSHRDEASLRKLAYTICANTAKPVDDDLEGHEWLQQFTDHNIRWESVGMLISK